MEPARRSRVSSSPEARREQELPDAGQLGAGGREIHAHRAAGVAGQREVQLPGDVARASALVSSMLAESASSGTSPMASVKRSSLAKSRKPRGADPLASDMSAIKVAWTRHVLARSDRAASPRPPEPDRPARGFAEAAARRARAGRSCARYRAQRRHRVRTRARPRRFALAGAVRRARPADDAAALEPLWCAARWTARGRAHPTRPSITSRTTGSTGVPEHVPIARSYVAEFQRTVHVSLYHCARSSRPPSAAAPLLRRLALRRPRARRLRRRHDERLQLHRDAASWCARVYAWPYELFEVQSLDARSFLALSSPRPRRR